MADGQGDFIAVDWGSTNRRAYLVAGDGRLVDSFGDERGVLSIPTAAFAAAVDEIAARLGGAPMLLAGMIGSNRGWAEAPYVPTPAGLADLAKGCRIVAQGRTIVPGLSTVGKRCDVMRGEEVQSLGAVAAGMVAPDARICHPGTHAKWISIEHARITQFQTAMTGEMFALLRTHSILASQLQGEVRSDPAFARGVDHGLSGEPLLDALFAVRSRMVLGASEGNDAAYVSGLLIGTDVATHARTGEAIVLIGSPELCGLYAAALERAGCRSHSVDGAAAFVAGMAAIRRLLC